MRHAYLFFLLLFSFAPVWAGPVDDIGERTQAWIEKGDLAHLAWTVRHYRQECLTLFQGRLRAQLREPNKERERWLNTVARAFRLEGMGRPNRVLEKHGLLWPLSAWRGTMFEADGAMGEYDLHGVWDAYEPDLDQFPPKEGPLR